MNDFTKKNILGNDLSGQGNYNMNSFRGNYGDLLKNKYDKELKITSPKIVRVKEKEIENFDRKAKVQYSGNIAKPKLLTGKLPSAFDMKYRNKCEIISDHENLLPRKLIANDNIINGNICITDVNEINSKEKRQNYSFYKQNSNKSEGNLLIDNFDSGKIKEETDEDLNTSVKEDNIEKKKITKPIIVRGTSSNSYRQKSTSPKKIDKLHYPKSNRDNNTTASNGNTSDGKSTGNNSHSSNVGNGNGVNAQPSISRTHELFFPKIQPPFEFEEEYDSAKANSNVSPCKNKFDSEHLSSPCRDITVIESPSSNGKHEIKLEEGISLSVSFQNALGRIRKFFHVPSFKLFIIKEIPINSKNFFTNVIDTISDWKSKFRTSEKFLHIEGEYINNPEGCLSVLFEDFQGNSLYEIINNTGTCNESFLYTITVQLMQIFSEFKEKTGQDYSEFCLCDVIYNKEGNIKLVPNIFKRYLSKELKCQCKDTFRAVEKIFLNSNANLKELTVNNYFNIKKEQHTQTETQTQTLSCFFCLGYTLLICATGGFQFKSIDFLSKDYSEPVDNVISKKCCLYHSLLYWDMNSRKSNPNNLMISQFITQKRFSKAFVDFLCLSLSFESTPTISITMHPWISIRPLEKYSLKIYPKELLRVLIENKRSTGISIPDTTKNERLINFLNKFEIIITNHTITSIDEFVNLIKTSKNEIKELCYELGVTKSEILARILVKLNSI